MKYEIRFATVKTAEQSRASSSSELAKKDVPVAGKAKEKPAKCETWATVWKCKWKRQREWVKCSASQMVSRAGGEEGGEARGSGYVDIRSKVRGKQREKAKGQKQSESL